MKLSKNEKGLEKTKSFQKKNKAIVIVFLGLLLILNIGMVEAVHWVCGEVNNAEDYMDAAWHDVIIYYENDKTNYASCEVGTEDYIYCCDSEAIPRHRWRIGDIIFAEVIDNGDGYIAGPVSVVTTGAGHDVEPKMTLKAIITINSPTNIVYNVNSIILNVTTTNPYNNAIWYSLDNNNNVTLCTNCNYPTTNLIDLSDAQHNIAVYVNDSSNNIGSKQVYFTIDAINDPPTIDSYAPIDTNPVITEEQSKLFSITKSDPNLGDVITVKWYKNGTELVGETNDNYTFSAAYTGNYSAGIYNIGVIISDGEYYNSQEWMLNVSNVNVAPVLATIGALTAIENQIFSYDVNASDIDEDILIFSDDTSLFDINHSTGLINFRPGPRDGGTYSINISVTDNNSLDYELISFTITAINDQPIIDSYSPINTTLTINERQSQLFSITKSDPDRTIPSVKWYLDEAEISGETNDNYNYTPDYSSAGVHNITVIVSDGLLAYQQYWDIIINNVPVCGDNTCDNSESCSLCSVDCGTCPSGRKRNITKYIENKAKYSKILPEKPVIMKMRDSSIKEIIIWVKNKVGDVKVIAKRLDEKPASVKVESPGIVYNYIEIISENIKDEVINKLIIRFKVEKQWIRENGINQEGIILYRYVPKTSAWKRLETVKANEDKNYIYYESKSVGLSTFAISTERKIEDIKSLVKEVIKEEEQPKKILVENKKRTGLLIGIFIIILFSLILMYNKNKKQ
ncbi:PGF-pre-PGF domain-containing protein [archaeon AH-315-M20]|nr:PGF-pre-PGF domain-containing protein [archaeon AH-315-M20]